MLRSLESLRNYVIRARDGDIGNVEEFYFDDQSWTVRYLVVNTGQWLSGRKVLISPLAIQAVDPSERRVQVRLSLHQVESSPDIDTRKPVSRQWEASYYDFYQMPYYWAGSGVMGMAPSRLEMIGEPSAQKHNNNVGDPHLRSTRAIKGYGIEAIDHRFGQVEDFIVDDQNWRIHYLVVETIKFWRGKSVLVSPHWVDSISWERRKFKINLTEEKIKNYPTYDPAMAVNRKYEERLYDYNGQPAYWESDASLDEGEPLEHIG